MYSTSFGEAAMADDYEMLEELGSEWFGNGIVSRFTKTNHTPGGSFGVVYKAIDKTTGDLVAIKHVRLD